MGVVCCLVTIMNSPVGILFDCVAIVCLFLSIIVSLFTHS